MKPQLSFVNRGLFSDHFLHERLPEWKEWKVDKDLNNFHSDLLALYEAKKPILPHINEAQTEEEFINNENLITIDDLRDKHIEKNTIYLFRTYQYSKNTLLAEFHGFNDIDAVKEHCRINNLDYSEFKSTNNIAIEFNNCWFVDSKNKETFDLEVLEDILVAEEYDIITRE